MPKQKYVVKIEVSRQEAHDRYEIEIANWDDNNYYKTLSWGSRKKTYIYTFLKT